ncbi:MAG: hypothetical protein KME06_12700 [Kastovskya adunca ATA6-11-RM4]|nr:hypothetical protein [Kastovskya adunca ATA6-11-RM4]
MFQLLYPLVHAIEPYLVPLCFVFAWSLAALFVLTLWTSIQSGAAQLKTMHQIPCTDCQFFTNDYHLKCTVHPSIANSEAAINCRDYCPQKNAYSATE